MPNTTAIITGANRGIGLALAAALAAREGMQVIATVRDRSTAADLQAIAAKGRVTIGDLELGDERSIESFAEFARRHAPIDLLIHNAGIMGTEELAALTFENMLDNLRINTVGPAVLTRHLLPHVRSGGLIVFISSRLGSIGVADGRRGYPYRASKAALNMIAKQLSLELRDQQIGVLAMSPGQVRTRMNPVGGQIQPKEAADGLLREIDNFTMEKTGTYRRYDGSTLPW